MANARSVENNHAQNTGILKIKKKTTTFSMDHLTTVTTIFEWHLSRCRERDSSLLKIIITVTEKCDPFRYQYYFSYNAYVLAAWA